MRFGKKSSMLLGLFVTLSLALAPIALDAGPKAKRSKRARVLNFEDDVVETTYLRPESSVVETLNKKKRASLIRIRMDYFAKIIRSAWNL